MLSELGDRWALSSHHPVLCNVWGRVGSELSSWPASASARNSSRRLLRNCEVDGDSHNDDDDAQDDEGDAE